MQGKYDICKNNLNNRNFTEYIKNYCKFSQRKISSRKINFEKKKFLQKNIYCEQF